MRQDVGKTHEVARLELLRQASTHGDLEAWAAFQQGLEETVQTWLHDHPNREAACRLQSERYFVAQAFEQLHQVVRSLSRGRWSARRSPKCWCTCVRV